MPSLTSRRSNITCRPCSIVQKQILAYYRRPMYLSPHKFTKNIYMNTPQRLSKLKSTAKKIRLQKKAISLLTERIRVWSEEHSVEVRSPIVVENSDEITAAFPEGSFQRLFWQQQKAMSACKKHTGRGWHPLLIRWAMSLKMQSSA